MAPRKVVLRRYDQVTESAQCLWSSYFSDANRKLSLIELKLQNGLLGRPAKTIPVILRPYRVRSIEYLSVVHLSLPEGRAAEVEPVPPAERSIHRALPIWPPAAEPLAETTIAGVKPFVARRLQPPAFHTQRSRVLHPDRCRRTVRSCPPS